MLTGSDYLHSTNEAIPAVVMRIKDMIVLIRMVSSNSSLLRFLFKKSYENTNLYNSEIYFQASFIIAK